MGRIPLAPISRALVVFAILTLSAEAAFGRDSGQSYRCTAKDAVGVQPDGTLDKGDPGAKSSRDHFDRMVINVDTGAITYPSDGTRENRVVQQTSVKADYVLIPGALFHRRKGAANATTNFIFLRIAPDKPQAMFAAHHLSYLVTGTCALLQ